MSGLYIKRDGCFIRYERVVWEELVGPVPDGHEVYHIDGDKRNNDISNLQVIDMVLARRHRSRNHAFVSGVWRKHCPGCDCWKSLDLDFYESGGKRSSFCKVCCVTRRRSYQAEWRKRNPTYMRDYWAKRKERLRRERESML